jgi:hypothetical protein
MSYERVVLKWVLRCEAGDSELSACALGLVTCCCEYGSEPSDSMKFEEFLEGEQLLVYQGALFSMEC